MCLDAVNLPQMVAKVLPALESICSNTIAASNVAWKPCWEVSLHVALEFCLAREQVDRSTARKATHQVGGWLTSGWNGGDVWTEDDDR